VNLANDRGLEVGMTFTVQGVVISGVLIGYQKYYDGIMRKFSQQSKVTTASNQDPKRLWVPYWKVLS